MLGIDADFLVCKGKFVVKPGLDVPDNFCVAAAREYLGEFFPDERIFFQEKHLPGGGIDGRDLSFCIHLTFAEAFCAAIARAVLLRDSACSDSTKSMLATGKPSAVILEVLSVPFLAITYAVHPL